MLLGRLLIDLECTHQLDLPWGTRHFVSPNLPGNDVMILLLAAYATGEGPVNFLG